MTLIRYLTWLVFAGFCFLLLLFAVKNTDPVTLQFFLGQSLQLPLIVLLFLFFVLGALLALLACLKSVFHGRREIALLKRKLAMTEAVSTDAPLKDAPQPPPADAVV